jgi:hypothetical protein
MGYVIDTYLDELFDRLAGTGAAGRRASGMRPPRFLTLLPRNP